MFDYNSLNDSQKRLHDSLRNEIEHRRDIKNILQNRSYSKEDIKRAFLTYNPQDPARFLLLQLAVINGDKQTVKELLDKAQALGILKDVLLAKGIQARTVLTWARNICKNKKLTGIIEIIEQGAKDAGLTQQNQQPVGTGIPFSEIRPTPHTQSGQAQAQEGGSVLTVDTLMENFHKLTQKQKDFHKRLNDVVYSGGNVYDVLKDIKADKDKKDILTTSAVYSDKDRSIPDKIIEKFITHNLLTLAIERGNVQATKEILQECKQLGILKQVLTTQSLHIVNGHQEVSIYALHHAAMCSNTEFCSDVLNAASDEPDLLKEILDLTLIYTNANGTETYTPLALAELKENTEIINIINRKMEENGLKVPDQPSLPHVSTGGTPSPAAQATPGVLVPEQKSLYHELIDAIKKNGSVKRVFAGQKTEDIKKAFLSTGASLPLLQFAAVEKNAQAVEELLDEAKKARILKNVLEQKVFDQTILDYVRGGYKNKEIIAIIEQSAKDAGLTQQSQQPVGTGAPFQEVRPELPQQSGQGQAQGGGDTRDPQQEILKNLVRLAFVDQKNIDKFIKELINAQNSNFDFHNTKLTDISDVIDAEAYEGRSILQIIVQNSSVDNEIVDALFSQKILTTENTVILLAEIIKTTTNLIHVNNHFVEHAIKHVTSNNIQGREDIAKTAIKAVHFTLDVGKKQEVQGKISYLERIVQSLEPLKSNADIGKGIDAFYSRAGRTPPPRDPQQKIFDELCNLVLQINEAKGADQGQLINTFSQKLDEALNGKFSVFEEFKTDDFIKSTAVQFVAHKINNQQCIKIFFNKISPSIQNNADNRKHISDSIAFSLNIEAIKTFFSIIKAQDNATEIINERASDISTQLIKEVQTVTPRAGDNFEKLCKVKTILNFLSEQNIKEKTKSEIQGYLNTTEEKMEKEKPFSWEARQAQPIQSPVGSPASSAASPTPAKSPLPLQARQAQPIQPGVAVPAPSAADATSGQSSLPPKVTKQVQPIQPGVAVPAPSAADAASGTSPLTLQNGQHQLTGTDGSIPDNTSALPDDLGDQITKTPTFWSEHRGKVAIGLYIVGAVIGGCAFIAGLPYEAACAIGAVGVLVIAIAVGILGKMAYEAVSEQANTDGTSKVKAAGTMLSNILPCIDPQEESRER